MSTKRVYLSGPITGLTYAGARYGWRKDFADLLEPGITVLSPMRHEGHLAEMKEKAILPDNLPEGLFSHSTLIVTKDFLDIDMADIVVVNLLGAVKPSEGTLIEYGYARAKGKVIITIKEPSNVHRTPFIPVISNVICESMGEAAAIVNSLLSEGI